MQDLALDGVVLVAHVQHFSTPFHEHTTELSRALDESDLVRRGALVVRERLARLQALRAWHDRVAHGHGQQ